MVDQSHAETLAAGVARLRRAPRRAVDFARDTVHAARAVVRGFRGENISLRAAALTYVTIFAIVPMMALALAVARSVGHDQLRTALRAFVVDVLAPGVQQRALDYLNGFIDRAGSGALGSFGAALVLVSAVGLLFNIEKSLNDIWAVPRQRRLAHRLAIYWVVLTLGPVLLGLSIVGTGYLRAALAGAGVPVSRSALAAVPALISWAVFTLLYWLTPNAPVRMRSALAGGLVAGAMWEVAKHGYALYATRSFTYDAIYGAFSAVPVFFLWVYVSWWIVLFGARLAFAVQYAALAAHPAQAVTPRSRELLCVRLLAALGERFDAGAKAPDARDLAKSLGVVEAPVRDAVAALKQARLAAELDDGGLIPARSTDAVTVAEVVAAVTPPHATPWPRQDVLGRAVAEAFDAADQARSQALASLRVGSLVRPPLTAGQSASDGMLAKA